MTRSLGSISGLLKDIGPFNEMPQEYSPDQAFEALGSSKILIVGAGGLGCEIIKNLALVGFKHLHIIDMDTVAMSNLNRQFLFRQKDIGQPKSVTAANAIQRRLKDPDLHIQAHVCAIQDMPQEFYRGFSVIICGLDNVEARRWINSLLVGFVDQQLNGLIPLVDGGTEGFRGQARVILPTLTSCFECSLDMIPPKSTFPVCTITNTPRLPEHCIEWASQFEWPSRYPDQEFDADDPGHVDTMHAMALARAEQYGIENVTRSLTLGVVKNIIPAIASTNAIIAAACCNEVFKIVTSCNPILDNYMMYLGDESVFTYTYSHAKNPSCAVCGNEAKRIVAQRWWTLQDFVLWLASDPKFSMKSPSISTSSISLFISHPETLRLQTAPNLCKKLQDLVAPGEEMLVSDHTLKISLSVVISAYIGDCERPYDE